MKKMYKSLKLLLIILSGWSFSTQAQTSTYGYISPGVPQTYIVPVNVTAVTITLQGGRGGFNSEEATYPDRGGYGACVTATIQVTPGQVLNLYVGGAGGNGTTTTGGAGGGNGGGGEGGAGHYGSIVFSGGGGGGSSDVRTGGTGLGNRILVAGGGGGAGINCSGVTNAVRGGDGGFVGETAPSPAPACVTATGAGGGGSGGPGLGGSCSSGCTGSAGSPGGILGGIGGDAGVGSDGGGGGGGYYGGGGGQGTGGGGGSDYVVFGATGVSEPPYPGCNTGGNGSISVTIACEGGSITGVDSACAGTGPYLFTESVPAGTWSSSNTAVASIDAGGNVYAGSPGVATIIFTQSPGCTAVFSFTSNPTPAIISGGGTICQNATTTYTGSLSGGTWGSSNGGVADVLISAGTTATVEGVGAGTSAISYTVFGCPSAPVTLSVNQSPAAFVVSGGATVCGTLTGTVIDVDLSGSESGVSYELYKAPATAVAGLPGSGSALAFGGPFATPGTYYIIGTEPTIVGGCTTSMTDSAYIVINPNPAISGSTDVCTGATITLTSTISGGTWSSSNTSVAAIAPAGATTATVTAGIAGTTTITNVSPDGCPTTATVTVNSSPTPITITSGSATMCIGATAALADATTGGAWSIAPAPPATIAGTGATAVVTGSASGAATVKYTTGTGVAACSVTFPITVSTSPLGITGPANVCTGDSVTLSDAVTGGTWSSSNTSLATIGTSSGELVGLPGLGGNVTITYAIGTGCSISKTETVNPTPANIGGNFTVCVGATTTLTDGTTGGTWTSGTVTVATVGSATGTVGGRSAAPANTTVITYTTAGGCTATQTITVNALPTPILGLLKVCAGGLATTTLTDAATPGTWSSGNTASAIVGSTTGIVTGEGTVAGTSTITFQSAATGCSITAIVTVNAAPVMAGGNIYSLCGVGATTTLTATPAGGTWLSGTTATATITAAGKVTAAATSTPGSTTLITYTEAGCTATATVTVNGAPLVPTVPAPGNACVGSSVTLNDGSGGGTWTAAPATIATIGSSSGSITGVSSGNATVVFTLATTGCSVNAVVTVDAQPAAIAITAPGTASICVNSTIAVTDATPGGTWSTNNGNASVGGGPGGTEIVTGRTGPGNTNIIYTNSATKCFITMPVTINPLPANITGNTGPFCGGTTLTLGDPGGGTWSSSTTAVASFSFPASSIVTGGAAAGTATITYALSTGCSATTVVTVNLQPPALITPVGDTLLCPGGFVELTANTGSGLSYQWSNHTGAIAGATNSTYNTGALFSTDSFTVTVSNGCSKTTPWMHVIVNPAPVALTGAALGCSVPGDTIHANTAPGLSYQWFSGSTLIPGAVDSYYVATTSGVYSLIETSSSGCSATSPPLPVTITASPTGSVAVSGPLTFCRGGSVTFSGSPGFTYQWYNAAGAIAGATTMEYTDTLAGRYWLTETNSLGCSASSLSSTVTILPLPIVPISAAGPRVFCTGGSVSLGTTAFGAGYAYQWFNDGSVITGAVTSNYIASSNGNYSVKVTNTATGCAATSVDSPVAVLTTPNIIPSTSSFCLGGSSILSVTIVPGVGPVTYQWLLDGTPIPGATNSVYVAGVAGTYTNQVTIAGAGGCSEVSISKLLTEFPLPNPVVSYDVETTTLSTQTYFRTYQWYDDLIAIPGATIYKTVAAANGNYKVDVTDSNGCQSISPAYPLTNFRNTTNAGTVTPNNGYIKIYPNPAQSVIHIESAIQVRAVVSSMDGRSLLDQSGAVDLDISGLANGIYMITVYDLKGQVRKIDKLVKVSN